MSHRTVRVVLGWLSASAFAPYLYLDAWPMGMLLTYPPRLPYAVLSLAIAIRTAVRRERPTAMFAAVTGVLFVGTLGWGGATLRVPSATHASMGTDTSTGIDTAAGFEAPAGLDAPAGSQASNELTILSFNVHNQPAVAGVLAELVDRERIDILSLQEVRLNNRSYFADALPEFAFFYPDRAKFPARSTGVFASMIGIRRERLDREDDVEVATAITGYRTFAVRASIGGQRLWIVDVHATKPFWLEDGWIALFAGAAGKARWHHDERDRLLRWLSEHAEAPRVVAGDFNAPLYSHNLRLAGLHDAHLDVGRGPHLTVPAAFPVWGIDHTLADDRVRFTEYRVFEAGPSDHRAQLARFVVRNGRDADTKTGTQPSGAAR